MRRPSPFAIALLALAACSSGSPGLGGLDATPYPEGTVQDGTGEDALAGDPGRDAKAELPPFEIPPQDAGGEDAPDAADVPPLDVPVPDLPYPLCQPCRTDLECETADVKAPCLSEGPDGSTCGYPCARDSDCPAGFDCVRNDAHGYQCRPAGGAACPCLPGFVEAGFRTTCWRESDMGRCEALRTCDQECPAVPPAPETCNGLDDDCDGTADQGLGTTTCGKGVCEVTVQNCVGGQPRPCVAGAPKAEECNLLDDDCDGETDEGLELLRCGKGTCAVEVPSCIDGRPQPCWPLPPGTETCNGLDDDCDGEVDDGFPSVTCGKGQCERTVSTCTDGAVTECVPGTPLAEACNGLDDDCDGAVDNGLGTFTCGTGACQRTVPSCEPDGVPACEPGQPKPEACNGIDDDCDGPVDEDFTLGAPCDGGDADLCVEGKVGCLPDGTAGCVEPGTGHVEACNGVDDDCDGRRDEEGCKCPVVERNGHLYLFCAVKTKWAVARDSCKSWNYHLASIGDASENAFVVDTARAASSDAWWIGLSDLAKEGTWSWVDGTAVSYLPWGDRQPNNGGILGNQDCVLFLEPAWGGGDRYLWNDANCGTDGDGGDFLNFVCEHP